MQEWEHTSSFKCARLLGLPSRCNPGFGQLGVLARITASVRKLAIHWHCFSILAVWDDVVHGAVLEQMNLVLAELADVCLVPQFFAELKIKESWFYQNTIQNRINKCFEFCESNFRLHGTSSTP
jgi:hypothetical protein